MWGYNENIQKYASAQLCFIVYISCLNFIYYYSYIFSYFLFDISTVVKKLLMFKFSICESNSFSYTTKNTNLHTTSAILGTIIIVIAFGFLIWCCIKIFCKKEPERIFPSVSTLDLRGIGNRQVEIEMEDTPHSSPSLSEKSQAGPTESTPPPSVSGIKKNGKENDDKVKKDKTKKEDSKDKDKDKTKKEDSKDKDKNKKEDTKEKKWWEKEVSLSDLLRRQQKREDGKEKESEKEKEKNDEKEKGEPEKGTKLQDESFYSPVEDDD